MKTIEYRWELINELIQLKGYSRYLEIGLNNGECFNHVKCTTKSSVDPAMGEYAHATPTYTMTSDEFFENVADDLPVFDIVFIDGLHHATQVDKDIKNSLEILSENGTIIIHDCIPRNKEAQEVPRNVRVWNGDVWKSLVKYRANGEWNAFTINTDEGLGVIQKGVTKDYSISLPDTWDTWEYLIANKINYLGIREPDFYKSFG